MKILLLTVSYPPRPLSGSRRAANLAKAFVRAGHEVEVRTPKFHERRNGRDESHERLTVRSIRCLPHPTEIYGGLKRFGETVFGTNEEVRNGSSEPDIEEWARPTWRRIPLSLLSVPDEQQSFVPAAIGVSLLSAWNNDVDLIYTTSPSHSTHFAGLILKKILKAPWIAEFRDPWILGDTPLKPKGRRSWLSDRLELRLESVCIQSADCLVAVSEGIRDALQRRSKKPASRVLLARNGIPNLRPSSNSRSTRERPLRLIHLGNLYGNRDPRPFLRGLASVVDGRFKEGELEVLFVGECWNGPILHKLVDDLGLSKIVHFRKWVPYSEGQTLLSNADLLLLFAQNQPIQIPNKLYEYLGWRKPIIAFVDEDGESAQMLRAVGGHHLLYTDANIAEIESTLYRALDTEPAVVTESCDSLLSKWKTENQLGRLIRDLENLATVNAS